MEEYFWRLAMSLSVRSARSAPSVSAALYRYMPWPASSCTLASRIALRRSDGARVIQLPSGCMPMISECACWAICLIIVARYLSGIQSRGSMRRSRAIVSSKWRCMSCSVIRPLLRDHGEHVVGGHHLAVGVLQLGVPADLAVVARPGADLLAGQRDAQRVAGLDRGEEAQVVDPVVREHRTVVGLYEQPRRQRDDQVSVGDAAAEERVLGRCLLVRMGVEGVAGELGEVLDVLECHRARAGLDGVADAQLAQRFRERVGVAEVARRALDPAAGGGPEHARAGLDRGALQVMEAAAHPAHLLPAAGPAGATVHQRRQRGAVAGRL